MLINNGFVVSKYKWLYADPVMNLQWHSHQFAESRERFSISLENVFLITVQFYLTTASQLYFSVF